MQRPSGNRRTVPQNAPRRRAGAHTSSQRRRETGSLRPLLIAITLLIIGIGIYYLDCAFVVGFGTPKFYNVTVNGIPLKGMTQTQAVDLFQDLFGKWSDTDYTLTYEDRTWVFRTEDLDASLDLDNALNLAWNLGHYGSLSSRVRTIRQMKKEAFAFTSELTYSEEKLDRFTEMLAEEIDRDAVDAVVVMDVDNPQIITESEDGRKLDRDEAKKAVIDLLLSGQSTASLPVQVVEPKVNSSDVSGGFDVIARCSTDMTSSNYNRYSNVRLALSYFNVMAVEDGDTVSFNNVVGARTKERGFREAKEYSGSSVVLGYGGGCCQASTTLYCAVLLAGCDIIERHPHNMRVSYMKASLDATVSWRNKDFVFRNNTGHTLYIYTNVTRDEAVVTIYGNKPEYKVRLESVVIKSGIKPTKKEYIEDVTGSHAYYTDQKVLKTRGKNGCTSQSWKVFYDWDTDEEVSRVQISQDVYNPGTNIYYRGVHERPAGQ